MTTNSSLLLDNVDINIVRIHVFRQSSQMLVNDLPLSNVLVDALWCVTYYLISSLFIPLVI